MTTAWFASVWFGALGLAVGSFLNVCIYRLPRRESIVHPRSRCPRCGQPLRWFDNIPVASYVVLRGRCRACRRRISLQYPLVEVVTATLFVAHYWQLGWDPPLLPRLILTAALVVLFAVDLQHQILPNVITIPGIVVGFLFSLTLPPGWPASLLGILIGGGLLMAIVELWGAWRKEEAMGMGDLKMLAMIGAFLGWQQTVATALLAFLLGSIVGLFVLLRVPSGPRYVFSLIALLATLYVAMVYAHLWMQLAGLGGMVFWLVLFLRRRALQKLAMPFGTLLAISGIVSSLFGERLMAWFPLWYAR